ncbi:MAG: (2Fe-2S)-binding protein [Candidatus Riflebacteria bacterium HGW-Riflebacteria-2]|nr:MAG: (2Fe-2S)-binding protein [Candidatus Riflebacteria bacterium HGW-Riflebacteria-2]
MKISFCLNSKKVEIEVSPQLTVLEMLRRDFRLTAAKEGCGKGECGACSVLLNGQPINSCLKLAATLKPGDSLISVEGLNDDKLMQNIQEAYVEEGAVQCGFCIPGMTMASYYLLKHNSTPDEHAIKQALSGNICRCTGYRKIEAAVKKAAERTKANE